MQHGHGADGREEFHVGPEGVHGHLHCATCGGRWEIRAGAARAIVDAPPLLRRIRGRPLARDGGRPLRRLRGRRGRRRERDHVPRPAGDSGTRDRASRIPTSRSWGSRSACPYPSPGHTAGCADAPAAIRARSRAPRQLRRSPRLRPRCADAGRVAAACGWSTPATSTALPRTGRATRPVPSRRCAPCLRQAPSRSCWAATTRSRSRSCAPTPAADRSPSSRSTRTSTSAMRSAGCGTATPRPMRRASEMAHVERIVQVGLRGVGSARTSDVADARAAGNLLVTARQLRERGVESRAWRAAARRTGLHRLRPRRARPLGRSRGERHLARRASPTTRRATCSAASRRAAASSARRSPSSCQRST